MTVRVRFTASRTRKRTLFTVSDLRTYDVTRHCDIVYCGTAAVCIRVNIRGMARGYKVICLKSCLNIRVTVTVMVRVRIRIKVRVRFAQI